MEEKDINIITLGEMGVGKTSIIKRIREEAFDEEEFTTEFIFSFFNIKKPYTRRNLIMNLNYHDTAGQERIINGLPKRYIRNSHIVLLVFSNIQTLNVIKEEFISSANFSPSFNILFFSSPKISLLFPIKINLELSILAFSL